MISLRQSQGLSIKPRVSLASPLWRLPASTFRGWNSKCATTVTRYLLRFWGPKHWSLCLPSKHFNHRAISQSDLFSIIVLLFLFEPGSHYVTKKNLKFLDGGESSCLNLLNTTTIGTQQRSSHLTLYPVSDDLPQVDANSEVPFGNTVRQMLPDNGCAPATAGGVGEDNRPSSDRHGIKTFLPAADLTYHSGTGDGTGT